MSEMLRCYRDFYGEGLSDLFITQQFQTIPTGHNRTLAVHSEIMITVATL
jgi:hypothetical protein